VNHRTDSEGSTARKMIAMVAGVAIAVFAGCATGYVVTSTPVATAQVNPDPKEPNELRSGAFHLVNAKGERRASIAMREKDSQPSYILYDTRGNERLVIGLNEGGQPHITFLASDSTVRSSLALGNDGDPSFTFYDPRGRPAAVYGLEEGQVPFITFTHEGKSLHLTNRDGNFVVRSDNWKTQNKEVALTVDEAGQPRLVARPTTGGKSDEE